jgi:REP element-mobilizing transposase RayT
LFFMTTAQHRGWTSRGYLPHYDAAGEIQHIVFRLHDSLPSHILAGAAKAPVRERFHLLEDALDKGGGARWLQRPAVAEVVQAALLGLDGARYDLEAWCVMPTHVHVLVRQAPGWPLADIVQACKSVSSRRANAILGRTGRFWAPDYFDRAVRDERNLETAFAYIEHNPVAAGLCAAPEAWPWSSAALRASGEFTGSEPLGGGEGVCGRGRPRSKSCGTGSPRPFTTPDPGGCTPGPRAPSPARGGAAVRWRGFGEP